MARHRAAPARAAAPTTPPPSASTGSAVLTGGRRVSDLAAALPHQGLTEAHPSGPLPRSSRHGAGLEADTAALDLAAIALAAASAGPAGTVGPTSGPTTGSSALPPAAPATSGLPAAPTTGGTPRPSFPAAVPSALAPITPSHAVPAVGRPAGRRVPLPTRTAGALALVGALAGGGVAVVGGNAVLTADPTPTTGELRTGDVANAAESSAAAAQLPTDGQGGQDGRHRAAGG